jgi:GT2 family glycosyltransferase
MDIRTVSVVVTTYNRTVKLEQCIRALLAQILEENVELKIIIVDDCSLSENQKEVYRIASLSGCILPIINLSNKGLSSSRNVGATHSQCDYILFLDDDIMVEPSYVMGHLSVLSSQEGVATVGSLRFPPNLTSGNNLMRYLSSRELRQRNFSQDFLNDLPAQYLGGGICGMHFNDFKAVNGFSEHFTFYGGEDVEMGKSLKQNGVRILYAPLAKADHYDSVNIDRYREKYMEAGREGVKLILKTDKFFFDNSTIRFLLPFKTNSSIKDRIVRFFVPLFLGKFSEIVLRKIANITINHSILYSEHLYHALFACWMFAGLRDDKSVAKSKVKYSN